MTPAEDPRAALARAAGRSVARGLNQGSSGNLSVRAGDGLWITPSARDMDGLTAADMVPLDRQGRAPAGMRPSSEWRFHRDIYAAFAAAGAIVHAHSPNAVALSCLRRDLPPFHYMVALAGGHDIRCARYATFGTQALSDAVLEALRGRRACLMANHGLLAWGADLDDALSLALEVETLCAQYLRACQAGTPVLLTAEEMDEVLTRFADYRPHADGPQRT